MEKTKRKFFIIMVLFCCFISLPIPALSKGLSGNVSVRGHVTKGGTYVAPHHRTSPDSTKENNWSTKGNVNPYTGKEGTKRPY